MNIEYESNNKLDDKLDSKSDNTEALDNLSMLQLSDSFFPTGMYTTSSGLEALFYQRKIKNSLQLKDLIKVYLEQQIGPADCTALGNAYEYAKKMDLEHVIEVDQMIYSMKLVREIREASTRSGTQLLKCLGSFVQNDLLSEYKKSIDAGICTGVYPVALAVAGSSLGIPKNNVCLMMLYSFSISLVGAALRLGMLNHFEGQKIIHDLKPDMVRIAKMYSDRPVSGMWQFAPGIDIIQIEHELMPSKMFIT